MKFDLTDFEASFERPNYISTQSAWVGHIPFTFFLISIFKPKVFVELGTHYGDSYMAFCQAVMKYNTGTRCYAVDHWKGDEHAGFYGEDVLDFFKKHHDPAFSHFSTLIRSTFDEAVGSFKDNSIDLLHIDGLHTYDAVSHDFNAWLPKLSKKSMVLFHDVCVKEGNAGVWKLWEEIERQYPCFLFEHSFGLGVVLTGANLKPGIRDFFSKKGKKAKSVKLFFERLGMELQQSVQVNQQSQDIAERERQKNEFIRVIDEQNKRFEELNDQLENVRNENTQLDVRLSETTTENETLTQRLEQSQKQNLELENQLAKNEIEKKEITRHLESARADHQAKEEQLLKEQADNQALSKRLDQSGKENLKLTDQLAKNEIEKGELTRQLEKAQLNSQAREAQLNREQAENKNLNQRLRAIEKETSKLEKQLINKKKELQRIVDQSVKFEREHQKLSLNLKKKNEESKDLSRRLADLERERDAFKNQLSKKENQLANLSFQLKDQALEHLKLSEQLAARTTESADLKHQVQTANSKLVRRDKQLKGLSQSFSWKLTSPLRWISHFFIKVVEFFKYSGSLSRIQKSGLFDGNWYLNHHLDVMESGMDPLRHYVIHGARENRKPAYWFDVEEYKYNHPEIEQSGINPFLHYCMNGDQDGNRLYPGERPAPPESWMQKLTSPWRWAQSCWSHYFENIHNARNIKRIKELKIFDGKWYLKEYQDIKESGMDPLEHYVKHGWKEGRRPAPWFNAQNYLANHPEAAKSKLNPFLHFHLNNTKTKASPSPKVEVVEEKRAPYSPIRPHQLGIRFYGPVNRVSGLGVPCRGLIRGLQERKFHTEVVCVNEGFEHQSIEPIEWINSKNCSGRDVISIVHLNADAIPQYWPKYGKEWEKSCYRIGVWSWELAAFRPDWINEITRFNEIWNSSRFMNTAIQACTNVPVIRMPPAIQLPKPGTNRASIRRQFKIPRDAFTFLYMFDASSFLERKNPLCLLNAFIHEFSEMEDAALVIKMAYTGTNEDVLKEIKNLCQSRKNIILIRDILDPESLSSLLASADCYVSPHRVEGFGLSIIEAMMLKVPVIATGYSGSNDFVTPATAFPIDYSLIEIENNVGPYLNGYVWADPKETHLRELMRTVYKGEGQVQKKVNAAYELVTQNYSLEAVANRLAHRIEEIIKITSAG